ncbi:hypothetical protein BDV96DRAFT_109843 [Lophiotrema nucula]|uniref:LPXTG-domain-containing protein n=1 Tax=Lophiotrema nucula TaxID=690887 RepID=A0A6A5Z6Y0_9PLEO|nr:hypothetical protein BDV96DRAFT_109843 [Lophiotrema nucula]
MMARSVLLFPAILSISFFAYALEVSPGSQCASRCLDDPAHGDPNDRSASLTYHQNVPCYDWQVMGNNATDVGIKYADCQSCLKDSGYEDSTYGERDTGWFLFNSKAPVDWCIFGRFGEENNENVTETDIYKQCNSACQSIFRSIDINVKSNPGGYEFCDSNGNFTSDVDSCVDCLYNSTGLTILGNIAKAVKEVCIQKPGKVFTLNANIYNTTQIKLPSEGGPTPSASPSASNPAAASQSVDGGGNSDSSGLSGGAIAGIVLGALVGIALVLVGILLLLRRLRRKRESGKVSEMPNGNGVHPQAPRNEGYYNGAIPSKQNYAYASGGNSPHQSPPTELVELSDRRAIAELPTTINAR